MNAEPREKSPSPRGMRRGILLLCAIVLVGILLAVGLRWHEATPIPVAEEPAIVAVETSLPAAPSELPVSKSAPAPVPVVSLPQATAYARQLVSTISRRDHPNAPLTYEEAQEWKKWMDALVQRGPDGVSAIMEFLEKRTDNLFGMEGRHLLGFDSARAALFDALVQIGGAEGLSATLQVLRDTGDPREIALLAQNLEKLAPELYRTEALNAAREVLVMAGGGKLPGSDVAPLFEVFQHYGGSDVVADLEESRRHWEYYSAIALAQLAEGAGIPSLIQIAQANSGGTMTALELLAQLSGRYAEARTALLEMVRRNEISSDAWPYLVSALAGNEYFFKNSAFVGPQGRAHPDNVSIAHIKAGNQTFYSAFSRGSLNAEQLKQRLAFLDELRSATVDQAALQTLQQSTDMLVARQPMMAAASP